MNSIDRHAYAVKPNVDATPTRTIVVGDKATPSVVAGDEQDSASARTRRLESICSDDPCERMRALASWICGR